MNNEKKKKKTESLTAQSVVEYIILMAVVIALLFVFFNPGANGFFRRTFTNVIEGQGQDMLDAARTIF